MLQSHLDTDYLVVGAGASSMAFVDTLLSESDATVVMVDRRDHPGGHWNDAYPFVRLHQPSAYYGVDSHELGRGLKDSAGLNAGLYELASKHEILDYYDRVMRGRFVQSGRVRWMPLSDYRLTSGEVHQIKSLVNGTTIDINVRRRVVNGTLAGVEIPLSHSPSYTVTPNVRHIPVNLLPSTQYLGQRYTVIGGGKTGMDACLWLLQRGVEPERLRWVIPRDSWIIDREQRQPFAENFESDRLRLLAELQSIIDARSLSHLFELLESRGTLLRLDENVEPTSYHCATLSRAELTELRRVVDVVRLGHVSSINLDRLVLEHGTVGADPETLYIDCSAAAVRELPNIPIFAGYQLNLLWVRFCQPVFSAAVIAFVEAHYENDETRNSLCRPVSAPQVPLDWPRMWQETLVNEMTWAGTPLLADWLLRCRLNAETTSARGMSPSDPGRQEMLGMIAVKAAEASAKIPSLLAETDHT